MRLYVVNVIRNVCQERYECDEVMEHCRFCQQAFVMKKYLNDHITKKHKEERNDEDR